MIPTQIPLGIGLRDSSVFASYWPGRNRPVIEALLALPRQAPPTCVWLHAASGLGKTHLLQALCARAGEREESAAYLPLRHARSMSTEVLVGLGQLALVCLDDAQAVLGDADWERALFRLHQELDEQRGRMIVAAGTPPAALPIQLRDLASRLNGGLVLTLQPLDDVEQIEALKLHAQIRGFELPEETAQFLIRRLPRDMATLCSFLDQLDRASLVAQRRLTVPFVREVLSRQLQAG
jgi:DnaA family protein